MSYHVQYNPLLQSIMSKVRAWAVSIARDSDRADELIQRTVVHTYQCFHTFEIGTEFSAWFYTAMRTQYLNMMRDEGKRAVRSINDEDWTDDQAVLAASPAIMFEEDFGDEILMALRRLTKLERLVVVGTMVELRLDEEIAVELGLSCASIRGIRLRGLRKLRTIREVVNYGASLGFQPNGRVIYRKRKTAAYKSFMMMTQHESDIIEQHQLQEAA